MTRKQFNARLPERTAEMIVKLARRGRCTQADVVIAAIEILYDREKNNFTPKQKPGQ